MGYKFNPFTGGLDSVNREGYIEGDLDVTGDLTVTGAISAASYGATVIQGIQGFTGATGPIGSTGATGFIGGTGATGFIGGTGATGFIGSTGFPGSTGATGPVPDGTEPSFTDIFASSGGWGLSLGTGAGESAVVKIANDALAQGETTNDITFNNNTVTVESKPLSAVYMFVLTIGAAKGEGTGADVQFGIGINGNPPTAGTFTRVNSVTQTPREMTASGLITLPGETSNTLELYMQKVAGGAAGVNTILIQSLQLSLVKTSGFIRGAQGATGASGVQGEIGPIGATGATGASGAQGEIGATGASGAQGEIGPIGATGATGASGAQGEIGATGATGLGATGATGLPGDRYATTSTTEFTLVPELTDTNAIFSVETGLAYTAAQNVIIAYDSSNFIKATIEVYDTDTGSLTAFPVTEVTGSGTYSLWQINLEGAPGPQGETGPIGATGATGASGDQGEIGATGASGAQGETGPIGATGATGASGDQGEIGATGASGVQGEIGATGATGPANTDFNDLSSTIVFSNENLETPTTNLSTVDNIIVLTQDTYDNLDIINPSTLYFVVSA